MYITNRHTQNKEIADILPASLDDLKTANKSGRFEFDWKAESKKEVYKLQLETTSEVLGLMAIENIPNEIRIDINVLEASRDNVGSDKNYEGIAGCLIAYACRLAFLYGYGGFVSLTPKTALIKHYIAIYGFVEMGMKVCTFDENSEKLIKQYLGGQ